MENVVGIKPNVTQHCFLLLFILELLHKKILETKGDFKVDVVTKLEPIFPIVLN